METKETMLGAGGEGMETKETMIGAGGEKEWRQRKPCEG